jgi:CheY-like chemotaxis protein
LMLPVMSGWEFRARQLANPRFSQIPAVVLSGVVDLELASQEIQAAAVIPKTLDFDLLIKNIERHC